MGLKTGDICTVKNVGKIYDSYNQFAESNRHPDAVLARHDYYGKNDNYRRLNRQKVKVLFLGEHECRDGLIAIVETIDCNPYAKFIIKTDGLENPIMPEPVNPGPVNPGRRRLTF
jgi:hypothetical protein